LKAQQLIVEGLNAHFPHLAIVGEEDETLSKKEKKEDGVKSSSS
tara:strand:+ start:366 stop:497 length:132 start_codon:yes stop_codon:yes gene_type:complete